MKNNLEFPWLRYINYNPNVYVVYTNTFSHLPFGNEKRTLLILLNLDINNRIIITYTMEEHTFSRKATLEDFFDEGEIINQSNNKHNKNHSHNDNDIKKNQEEFGHKKRIKP
jgi:hypothetical protein